MHQQKQNGKDSSHVYSNNSNGQYGNPATSLYGSNVRPTTQTFSQSNPLGTLSAQNLMFLPANSNQFPMMVQQSGNIPGVRVPLPTRNDEESRLKYQKDRQLEQQKQKLQQAFAHMSTSGNQGRQDAQFQRDAMIAQIIGPLQAGVGDRHSSVAANIPSSVSMPLHETLTQSNQSSHSSKKTNHNSSKIVPSSSSSSVHLAPHDLDRMMKQCYDLSNDSTKAHGFVKSNHSLNNMAPTLVSVQNLYKPDPHAAVWNFNKTTNLEGVFVLPSNMPPSNSVNPINYPLVPGAYPVWKPFPSWLNDVSKVPKDYVKLLHNCIPPNRFEEIPDTGLVYILLRASELSNDVLGAIWAIVNRTQPGQLTKVEFFAAMALVAFAQKTNKMPTFDTLDTMNAPLVPSFTNLDPIVQSQFAGSVQTKLIQPPAPQTLLQQPIPQTLQQQPALDPIKKDDEFTEFTDFQTADNNLYTQNVLVSNDKGEPNVKPYENLVREVESKHIEVSTYNEDPYASLRQLDPSQNTNLDSVQLRPITNSISENNFVFHNSVKELGATHNVDQFQKVFGEKNVSNQAHVGPKIHPIADHSTQNCIDQSLPGAFSDLENDNLTKYVLGHTSFDSPDSCSLHSKEPSLHSLDLKSVLTIDSNEDVKEADNDFGLGQQNFSKSNGQINGTIISSPTNLFDRYASVGESRMASSEEKHIDAWTKILEACLKLLQESCDNFSKASTTAVCKEILNSDRGSIYVKSLIEIYLVARKVKVSLKTNTFQTDYLTDMLTDIETAWETLCTFLCFSELIPKESEIQFKVDSLKSDSNDDQNEACGICLLNVNAGSKMNGNCVPKVNSTNKIINYSGRQYHSQCANLWINCVEPLLPALKIPNLL